MASENRTTASSPSRLNTLRKLLAEGKISTQEELVEELSSRKFKVTQSTISRDLRRIGAIKTTDAAGNIVYRLPTDVTAASALPASSMKDLILEIKHNQSLIVIHTAIGSASLVARHLDQVRSAGILGTIAGDDTIFVAPASITKIPETIKKIFESL